MTLFLTQCRPKEAEYLDDYPLNEGLKLPHEMIGVQLRDGQKWALSGLHGGIDILLVAKTGFGQTLIHRLPASIVPVSKRAITLIISPLMADQALDLKRLFG